MENNDAVKSYYADVFNENERELRETLEFARSKNIISRFLHSSSMDIADICGGTGAYAFWLAEMGHIVHLLDLAENHIEIARQKSIEKSVELASYTCADARNLPYENESMDMVLLMGALYHLQSKESRMKCLQEAFRVLKKDGIMICTVMNRYNFLISSMKYRHLIDAMGLEPIKQALYSGIIDNNAYTKLPLSYGHTPEEIVCEMTESGFVNIVQVAVEGIANALGNNTLPTDDKEAKQLISCIELVESVPELIGVSRNIISIGTKP
ncbi:MAG: class I SAM-dependent methyltransferase [Firmicutes bacterium]|nr:class I SAM-dependent methyltransferase [Bacillota bacterium]